MSASSNQTMIENSKINLTLILANYVGYINNDYGDIIDIEERRLMASSLSVFVTKAVDKYFKGQKEHGGNITDKDLNAEIQNEITDLMWYNFANSWKNYHVPPPSSNS